MQDYYLSRNNIQYVAHSTSTGHCIMRTLKFIKVLWCNNRLYCPSTLESSEMLSEISLSNNCSPGHAEFTFPYKNYFKCRRYVTSLECYDFTLIQLTCVGIKSDMVRLLERLSGQIRQCPVCPVFARLYICTTRQFLVAENWYKKRNGVKFRKLEIVVHKTTSKLMTANISTNCIARSENVFEG